MEIIYKFKDLLPGTADGTIYISSNENVALFWGINENSVYTKLDGYTPLISGAVPENGIVIDKGLLIPEKVNSLILCDMNDNVLCTYDLPKEKNAISNGKALYTASFVSDLHLGGWGSEFAPKEGIAKARDFINKNADFLVIAGDLVQWHGAYSGLEFGKYNYDGKTFGDNGERSPEYQKIGISQWQVLNEYLKGFDIPVFPTSGGHDIRESENWSTMCSNDKYYQDFLENWVTYLKESGKHNIDRDNTVGYYDTEISGNHYIFLQIPERAGDKFSIKQLDWLDKKLSEINQNNKPVFVIGHEPLASELCGNTKELFSGADKINKVLSKHSSVIYVSGHTHLTLDTFYRNAIEGKKNSPSYVHDGGMTTVIKSYGKRQEEGTHGIFIDVYDSFAVVRGRDFLNGKWISAALTKLNF